MSDRHRIHYIVKARRNNIIVHLQEALDGDDAQRLKEQFEAVAGTTADICEVHERAETDVTTHTREIVEDIAKRARS